MVQQSPRRLELTVTADQAGEKIDTLLRRELRLSGTVIRRVKWLDDGILLDGMRVTTGHRPAAGQVLSVRVADPDGQGDMVPTPGPPGYRVRGRGSAGAQQGPRRAGPPRSRPLQRYAL
ncbi:hypothetical protein M5E87_27810 [Flavonifractor plautii]|nr:hypothetical protein M5E87_27810 [Flavonifractor plautii]